MSIDYAPEPTVHQLAEKVAKMEAEVVALKADLKPHVDRAVKADAEAAPAAEPPAPKEK